MSPEDRKKILDSLPPGVADALRRGQKIEALKRLRESRSLGLAEAKSLLDALLDARPQPEKHAPKAGMQAAPLVTRRPGLSPGEVPRSGSEAGALVLIAVAIAAAFLLWWFR